jgi:hypothetical protein
MKQAEADGVLVTAGPASPEVAKCPTCGAEVEKRKRRSGRDNYTYFYRHKRGTGDGCPNRYHPTST